MKFLLNVLRGVKFQECCANFCRDWHETAGGLPASEHSPACPNYKTETFYSVAQIDSPLTRCIVATIEEARNIAICDPAKYVIKPIEMTRDQFDNMPEFEGF